MIQRELKFRVWNGSKMLGMKEIGFIPPLHSNIVPTLHDAFESMKKGMHVMQFTGLRDKSEKEIYEGDIVRILYTDWISCSGCHETVEEHMLSKSEVKVVIWSVQGFYVSNTIDGYAESMEPGRHGYIEVIGNIYQNPELLK